MINYIKTLFANIFFYLGYGIMHFGIKLHKLLNTETGKRLVVMEQFQTEFYNELLTMAAQYPSTQPKTSDTFYVTPKNSNKNN